MHSLDLGNDILDDNLYIAALRPSTPLAKMSYNSDDYAPHAFQSNESHDSYSLGTRRPFIDSVPLDDRESYSSSQVMAHDLHLAGYHPNPISLYYANDIYADQQLAENFWRPFEPDCHSAVIMPPRGPRSIPDTEHPYPSQHHAAHHHLKPYEPVRIWLYARSLRASNRLGNISSGSDSSIADYTHPNNPFVHFAVNIRGLFYEAVKKDGVLHFRQSDPRDWTHEHQREHVGWTVLSHEEIMNIGKLMSHATGRGSTEPVIL